MYNSHKKHKSSYDCKFSNDLLPPMMNDIFQKQENCYSPRNPRLLVSKRKFTTSYGIDTIDTISVSGENMLVFQIFRVSNFSRFPASQILQTY